MILPSSTLRTFWGRTSREKKHPVVAKFFLSHMWFLPPGEATWGGEKTKQEDDYEDASFEVNFHLISDFFIWSSSFLIFDLINHSAQQDVIIHQYTTTWCNNPLLRGVLGCKGGLSANKCDPQYIEICSMKKNGQ